MVVYESDKLYHFNGIARNYLAWGTLLNYAEEVGCYWFLDIIASGFLVENVRNTSFQIWELEKYNENSAKVTCYDRYSGKILYEQDIPFTDFPHKALEVRASKDSIDDKDVMVLYFNKPPIKE